MSWSHNFIDLNANCNQRRLKIEIVSLDNFMISHRELT